MPFAFPAELFQIRSRPGRGLAGLLNSLLTATDRESELRFWNSEMSAAGSSPPWKRRALSFSIQSVP